MARKIIPIISESGAPNPCSYKPGQVRSYTALAADARSEFEAAAFKAHMIKEGYEDTILPHVVGSLSCEFCRACVPLRIVVADFTPSANQRKFLRKNEDLNVFVRESYLDPNEYDLYLRHFADRFANQGLEPLSPDEYVQSKMTYSHEQIIRNPKNGRLLGLLAIEDFGDSLYASSQIYDPIDSAERSLGHLGILKLIEYAQKQPRIKHIYLGSWAKDSALVGYKERYQPLEAKIGPGEKGWVRFNPSVHTQGYQPPLIDQLLIKLT